MIYNEKLIEECKVTWGFLFNSFFEVLECLFELSKLFYGEFPARKILF